MRQSGRHDFLEDSNKASANDANGERRRREGASKVQITEATDDEEGGGTTVASTYDGSATFGHRA